MSKVRLDQLYNRMNQCSAEHASRLYEDHSLKADIGNQKANYDKVKRDCAQEQKAVASKQSELNTLSTANLAVRREIDAETSLVAILDGYLAEYIPPQEELPDISVLGIQGDQLLDQMIGDVDQS